MSAAQLFQTRGFGLTGPASLSLGKPPAAFPGRVATDADLIIAVDRQQTKLATALSATATAMNLLSVASIVPWCLLTIDDEIVQVTCPATGNTVPIRRAFDGTVAAVHLGGATVAGLIDAFHHNTLVAEVEAIETTLGANLSNLPTSIGYVTNAYDFAAQSPGVALSPGANAFTLNPIPQGLAVNNSLYISGGTGTAEAVKITGWNPTTGAIIVTCANAHTGGWTIQSASFGLQECIVYAGQHGGGTVNVSLGVKTLYATVNIFFSNIHVLGLGYDNGGNGSVINRTGDFGDSIYAYQVHNISIVGLTINQVVNYVAALPPTVDNKPTKGSHIYIKTCSFVRITDNRLTHMVYQINIDGVGYCWVEHNSLTGLWDYQYPVAQICQAGILCQHSESSFGYPTYIWVRQNLIIGLGSASRTFTENGHVHTAVEPVGPHYGIWITSVEVGWFNENNIEWCGHSGILVAEFAPHSVSDAILAISIIDNYIDYCKYAGIYYTMSNNLPGYALNSRIANNKILGSQMTTWGIRFDNNGTTYVRTAAETCIIGNSIRTTLAAGIFLGSGGNTIITGNQITSYNCFNDYAGVASGNSAIWVGNSAAYYSITGNYLGGNYLGGPWDGTNTFTVCGISIETPLSPSAIPVVTSPNTDGGCQPLNSRGVLFDPAFSPPRYTLAQANAISSTKSQGAQAVITDSTATTWGSAIVPGGTNVVLCQWNGTAWTIIGK